MPRLITEDQAAAWKEEHGERVNAGDAAAILWESPWDSAYTLYLRKIGQIPRKEQTPAMARGNEVEPEIFAWYEQIKELNGGISQAWAMHDDADFIQAKVDYWHPKLRRLAEFKAPFRDDSRDHKTAKAGEVPYHYWLQCQHELAVYDVAEMDFVSWRSAADMALITVKRDREFWDNVMFPAYFEFQQRVRDRAWPMPNGSIEQRDEEWAMWARRYAEAANAMRAAEGALDRAKAAIKRMADCGARNIEGAGLRASWTSYKPRWEVSISVNSKQVLDELLTELQSVEQRRGVNRLSTREYPANLLLRIATSE